MRDSAKERKLLFLISTFTLFIIWMSYSNCFALQNKPLPAKEEELIFAPPADTISTQSDPLQKFNRAIFAFNDNLDCFILKPVAFLYNKIIPKPLNLGIHNFYNNINNVPTIANDILQLHFYQMLRDSWRLLINTTLGIGGFFDVASYMGLPQYNNDFGLTLAHYGWKNSTYIVLPFFGPCTIRDGVEIPVDYYYLSVYPYIYPPARRLQIWGLGVVDRRAQLLKFESVMEEAALDKYSFVRNAYLQRRAFQIEANEENYARTTITQPVQEAAKPVSQGVGDPPQLTASPLADTTNTAALLFLAES